MGTFQKRLAGAIKEATDVVTISRDDGYYRIEIARGTEAFGTLRQHGQVSVEKATPGALVGAIEDISRGLSAAVETVEAAQAGQEAT